MKEIELLYKINNKQAQSIRKQLANFLIDKVLEIAKKIINRAFELYPDKNDTEEEKPL